MPVLSIGEIKYMKTLHKKISYHFFNEIREWEIFQAILGKFRENSDWDWDWISAPNWVLKKHCQVSYKNHFLYIKVLQLE